MNDYTIYCTPEQTKKAFELGAPIIIFVHAKGDDKGSYKPIDDYTDAIIPTAEQMLGWLEEQYRIHIESEYCLTYKNYDFCILDENKPIGSKYRTMFNTKFGLPSYSSRKEATLAAIDVVLDYLNENKKNYDDRSRNN